VNGARVPYAGIASRGIALAVDLLLAHLAVLTGGAVLALVASLAGGVHLDALERLLAGVAWFAVVAVYFVVGWSAAGQTPGMSLLGLRVVTRDGGDLSIPRSALRLAGLVLAIVPMFAGFLPVLVDDRRRALQDLLAGTVVVYEPAAVARPAVTVLDEPPGGAPVGMRDADTHRAAPLSAPVAAPRISRTSTSKRGART
jgi:uncharacterized RDD family membrane protein YckC